MCETNEDASGRKSAQWWYIQKTKPTGACTSEEGQTWQVLLISNNKPAFTIKNKPTMRQQYKVNISKLQLKCACLEMWRVSVWFAEGKCEKKWRCLWLYGRDSQSILRGAVTWDDEEHGCRNPPEDSPRLRSYPKPNSKETCYFPTLIDCGTFSFVTSCCLLSFVGCQVSEATS